MQMGYTTNLRDLHELRNNLSKEERKETRNKLKTIKEKLGEANYCNWGETISTEAVVLFERVRQGHQTNPEEVQTYSNQIKCMQQGFSAGLNVTESNQLPDKLNEIKKLIDTGMLTKVEDDDNILISTYLRTYDEQIAFRKRIQKVCSMGFAVNTDTFETALRKDLQDRTTMGTSNKTISITDINNQLLAIRTASKIDLTKVP
jgi:hypothetical protein